MPVIVRPERAILRRTTARPMLSDALDTLDRDRAAFLSAYDALTPAQRSFRPADGGWTAVEIAQHLALTDASTLAIVRKQAAAGDARRDVGTPDDDRLAGVEAFLRSEARIPMPASVEAVIRPDGPPDEDWRGRFAAFADDWSAFADAFPAELETVALLDHPRAGALRADGAARFVAAHIEHHARQLARLCASEGFPA